MTNRMKKLTLIPIILLIGCLDDPETECVTDIQSFEVFYTPYQGTCSEASHDLVTAYDYQVLADVGCVSDELQTDVFDEGAACSVTRIYYTSTQDGIPSGHAMMEISGDECELACFQTYRRRAKRAEESLIMATGK